MALQEGAGNFREENWRRPQGLYPLTVGSVNYCILQGDGVEKETICNLSMIYVTTGVSVLAQNLYQQWLLI
jgi:hypothetical protein